MPPVRAKPRLTSGRSPGQRGSSSNRLRSRKLFSDPGGDCAFEFVEVVFEEVMCAANDYEADLRVLFEARGHFFDALGVTKLVQLAVDQQQWFAARLQKLEVVFVERRADPN